MDEILELNRLEYMILDTLHGGNYIDHFHSMTISEMLEENAGTLGARMTVYKKLIKLVKAGYIAKGVVDDHADTYYILEKGIKVVEGGNKG